MPALARWPRRLRGSAGSPGVNRAADNTAPARPRAGRLWLGSRRGLFKCSGGLKGGAGMQEPLEQLGEGFVLNASEVRQQLCQLHGAAPPEGEVWAGRSGGLLEQGEGEGGVSFSKGGPGGAFEG